MKTRAKSRLARDYVLDPAEPSLREQRDRLLVELELQQTRARFEIERLQQRERELDNSHRQFKALSQVVQIGFLALNERGVIQEWNEPARQILDSRRTSLRNAPLTFFVIREDATAVLEHLRQCRRATGSKVITEVRVKRPGREPLPVQLSSIGIRNGEDKVFHTALIDLKERKRAEQAVAQARDFAEAIIQTIHEPLVVIDSRLRVVRLNNAFSRLFQVPSVLAQGLVLESVFNLRSRVNPFRTKLEQIVADGKPLNNFEFEVSPRHLGPRVILCNAQRLVCKESSEPLVLLALEDITTRKEAQQQLASYTQQLQGLNESLEQRVAARTRELQESNKQLEGFCYSIAHDLRAPLRAMAGFSSALLDEGCLDGKAIDYARRIIAAGEHMDSLIKDLLEYGRFNTVDVTPTPIEAEAVLNRVLSTLQEAILERNATIVRKNKLPVVLANEVVLETVFSNLVNNALKFVPPGIHPEVTIWADATTSSVKIWIADNGIGIDPRFHERIFEVFQRLHSEKAYPGTGIGLAIVRRSVQRIGGTVGLESEAGKGCRFWIGLQKPAVQ